jgi:phospho-N-acetylmuramoyl-pentapeptide-transferase
MIINVFKVFVPLTLAFTVGILLTPILTHYLYKYKLWKKRAGKTDLEGKATPIFNKLHEHKEVGTPRMGGIIIWVSVGVTVIFLWLLSLIWPSDISTKLNFLSRDQTWVPFGTLLIGSLVGLLDDWLEISRQRESGNGGMPFRQRLAIVLLLGLGLVWWLFYKLDITAIFIPFYGDIFIGYWLIPLFLLVLTALFSSGVIDGLDGLAGGVMSIIFAAYSAIAFFQNQINLAALCAAIAGGTLAFLWFNIPPARFYMSETGILGLTSTLTVIAFLTNSVAVLPIIAFPLTATVIANVIQISSKKLFKRKVFLVAPIHHHFEALGWPAYKVVMRYWIIGFITAVVGMVVFLISRV